MRIARFYGHSVMVDGLSASSVIVDLGSNNGRFALAIVDRFKCKVFCVEPNPRLHQKLASNPTISAFNLAVTPRTGSVRFYLAENAECSSLLRPTISRTIDEIKCQGVTLVDLLSTIGIGRLDVLKVDIEGLELEMLATLGASVLDRINQLTVEFHESIGMGTVKQVLEIIEHLERFGFRAVRGSFFDYSDVLFLHEERLRIPSNWRWIAKAETIRNGLARRLGLSMRAR